MGKASRQKRERAREPEVRETPEIREAVDRVPRVPWVLPALVALVTAVTFLPALRNGFVAFDDWRNFLTNPHYRGLGPAQLEWMFTTFHMGHYIPLTWMTLGLDYALWGMNPRGYHLTALLLHAATAVAFLFVARRLLRLGFGAAGRDTAIDLGALFSALFFAVHPLRVESVAWVTERRDVLSGLFYLLAILAYLRFTGATDRRRRWYLASVSLFMCALLSKSMAVTLPIVLLILDVYPLRRLGGAVGWRGERARRVYAEKIPFALLSLAASAVAVVGLFHLDNRASLDRLGIFGRLAISAYSLVFYLWKTIVPVKLSPLYELPEVVQPWSLPFVLSVAGVIAITALALRLRRRFPALLAAWVAYVVILLPVLGILQNGPQIAADRYTYLACLPWALLIGAGVARIPSRFRAPALAAASAAVAGLALLTAVQTNVWRDPVTLWRHAAAVDPHGFIIRYNLGRELHNAGHTAEAIPHYELALRERPGSLKALLDAGAAYAKLRDFEHSGEKWKRMLTIRPDDPDALFSLGLAASTTGRTAEAIDYFKRTIASEPDYVEAHTELANAYLKTGEPQKGIDHLEMARRITSPYKRPE